MDDLWYGSHNKLVDARLGIINNLFNKARVHHVVDSINSQRRLSNVCGNDDLLVNKWITLKVYEIKCTLIQQRQVF